MLIPAHWKHKSSIHIDFAASDGGVAIFFPRMYIFADHTAYNMDARRIWLERRPLLRNTKEHKINTDTELLSKFLAARAVALW